MGACMTSRHAAGDRVTRVRTVQNVDAPRCRPHGAVKRALPHCAVLLLLAGPGAWAQATRFDGVWKGTIVCPPHSGTDDAKGYTHHFKGQVVNGELSATRGEEGEPGWHFLHGPIADSGDARLCLNGVVNNPNYAINKAHQGKRYSYRVNARFTETSGTGERATGRVCTFSFSR